MSLIELKDVNKKYQSGEVVVNAAGSDRACR